MSFSMLSNCSENNPVLPSVLLRSYSKADHGYARLLVTVTHRRESKNNPGLVYQAISQTLEGKASPVLGSWRSLNRGSSMENMAVSEDLVGMVSGNPQVIAYSPELEKKFKAISSNMFMDDEARMWTLKTTDNGKLWVRTTAHDDDKLLEELLSTSSAAAYNSHIYQHRFLRGFDSFASASTYAVYGDTLDLTCSRFIQTASTDSIKSKKSSDFLGMVAGGDLVAYVSNSDSYQDDQVVPNSRGFAIGYVVSTVVDPRQPVNSLVVQGFNKKNYDVICPNMLLCATYMGDDMEESLGLQQNDVQASALRSNVSLEDILNYYRTLYSRNVDFYKKVEDRIKKHFL